MSLRRCSSIHLLILTLGLFAAAALGRAATPTILPRIVDLGEQKNRVRLCSVWLAHHAAGLVEATDDDQCDPGLGRLQVAVAAGERAHDGELGLAQDVGEADECSIRRDR